jgi:hypothetical protein
MKTLRNEVVVALLILGAGVGCTRSSNPEPPAETEDISADSSAEGGKTGTRLYWKVVLEKGKVYHREQRTALVSLECAVYPEYPEYASAKRLRAYLIEIGAYTEDGKVYDRSGREICFLDGFAWEREERERHPKDVTRDSREHWRGLANRERADVVRRRAELEKEYRVLVIKNDRPPVAYKGEKDTKD